MAHQWEVRHEGMLVLLKHSGFYHLSFLKRVQLDHALLNALVERWCRETQTFHLRFGENTVLLKDVAILTGLRVHGAPVTGPTNCNWGAIERTASGPRTSTYQRWFYQHGMAA